MKILFVCTGNTCRSVLAHYYAAKLAADGSLAAGGLNGARPSGSLLVRFWRVLSAQKPAAGPQTSGAALSRALEFSSAGLGVAKDIPQPPIVSELLRKDGVREFSHTPVPLTAEIAEGADLILTMTSAHKTAIAGLFPKTAAKTATLAEYAGFGAEDIADPYGRDDLFYFEVFKLIKTYVNAALERLKKEV